MEIIINKKNVDAAAEKIVYFLTNYAIDNEPEIAIDNDGIGPYEYWGAKGIDYGHNSALIEDSKKMAFSIDVHGCSDEFIEDCIMGIEYEFFGYKSYKFEMKRGNDVSIQVAFKVKKPVENDGIITFTGEWIEV